MTSHPKSPRTTGDEAVEIYLFKVLSQALAGEEECMF